MHSADHSVSAWEALLLEKRAKVFVFRQTINSLQLVPTSQNLELVLRLHLNSAIMIHVFLSG